jgi:GMP synthase-like glutamine amidotransferase
MRFHVLQHVSFETAGALGDEIRQRGHSLQTTAVYDHNPLPSLAEFDGLIVMGGPMSIHDEVEFPWLVAEKKLIGAAIREEKKVLGICLGAQLIAAVCGARVYQNAHKEIGWWPVKWADGTEEVVFHWHGETFDLPAEAWLRASSVACLNQAFSLGDNVLGIQFHPEATGEIIRGMVEHERWELSPAGDAPWVQPADQILGYPGEKAVHRIEWLFDWLCPIQV